MRWLIVLIASLFFATDATASGGSDYIDSKDILPRVVFWTGDHWEEFAEIYVVFVRTASEYDDEDNEVTTETEMRIVSIQTWHGVFPGCYQNLGD